MKITNETNKEKTLYHLLNAWYIDKADGLLRASTCRCYRLAISHIQQFSKDLPLAELTERYIQQILNLMATKGYAKSTIDKVRIVLKNSVFYAVHEQWLDRFPLFKLTIPKIAPQTKVEALTRSDQQKIEWQCWNCKYGHVTLFLLHTGLRSSELYHLEWEHVHVDGKYPYVFIQSSKTENGIRIVPLDSVAVEILNKLPRMNRFVFLNTNGQPITSTVLSKHNRRLREKTGIKKFHNHICRHTFATRALENGMNIKALSKILGHSSVAFTMSRYTTITTDFIFEQMSLLDQKQNQQQGYTENSIA